MIINLQADYKKIIIKEIEESGLSYSSENDDDKLIIKYYSYLRKKAFAGPHKIVKSKNFTCPPEVKKGFEQLEDIIKKGGDITPYFNRIATNLSKYDDLFSDWGVMHFHLGDEFIEGEHLVKRNDPVLFAYLHQDIVYFINIYNHGHWEDYGVIQTIYDNWPQILKPYMLPKGMKVTLTIHQTDLKKIRRKGILTFVTIKNELGEDISLMPPGMGLNTARTSNYDVRVYHNILNNLGRLQLYLISHEEGLKELMKSHGVQPNREISLELIGINQNEVLLLDKRYWYPLKLYI